MSLKQTNIIFTILVAIYFSILVYVSDSLSISQKEADIYFNNVHHILWYLTHLSTSLFDNNNIALRLPFIIFYIASIILMYILTNDYFKTHQDRFISILIFMLLPGLNSAALLVDSSIVVVFGILLYIYIYKIYKKECYVLLIIFLFIDNSFSILFLALFFYSLKKKDNVLLIVSLVLFGISMQMYGFEIGGKPRGYFIETFSIYASIFSPILFLFFFYTIYRIALKGKRDIFWYIAFTSLGLSLLFSLRQKIYIADFAPFVVIATPLMVKLFFHSYRVRLRRFRINHLRAAKLMLSILLINIIILLFNKPLYLLIPNNKKHFAYKMHGIDELVKILKINKINSVLCNNKRLQKQLLFYGVTKGNKYYLRKDTEKMYFKKIDIEYYGKVIKTYYILLRN